MLIATPLLERCAASFTVVVGAETVCSVGLCIAFAMVLLLSCAATEVPPEGDVP